MKVWLMTYDENNMYLDPIDYNVFDFVGGFNGLPILNWKTAQLKVLKKGKYRDYAYLTGGMPVFSSKVLELLKDMLDPNVQYLDCDVVNYGSSLTMVNVINLIDAVDYSRSIPDLSPWGKLRGFHKLCFLESLVAEQHIFKIPEFSYLGVYVSDQFREKILNAKLKGFVFKEVWDSERTGEVEQEDQRRYEAFLKELEHNKGEEWNWSEAIGKVEEGAAVASGPWKLQQDQNGILQVARLGLDCKYSWLKSDIVPPILLGLKWHVVEKSDM